MTITKDMITVIIAVVVILGFVLCCKVKRRSRDKHCFTSWYNHLSDQYHNIFQNVADNFSNKIVLAEEYKDQNSLRRLQNLYDDTVRMAERIEKKLNSLKINVVDIKFAGVPFDTVFNELKVVEGYIVELAYIATLILNIHPVNRNYSSEYEDEGFTSKQKTENDKLLKTSRFFSSCNTKDEIKKKYKELAKIYHPDNIVTGSVDSFKQLKAEYDEYIMYF